MFEVGATVNAESLKAKGLIKSLKKPIKLLADGEVSVSGLTLDVDAYSAAAGKALEAVGGRLSQQKEGN